MGKSATAARILLGLIFLVLGGLNGFFRFIPTPPLPEEGEAFIRAVVQTGYLFPLLKTTELVCGLLLLLNRLVPLTLVILAPIIVNIVAFNLFLAPSGAFLGLLVLALELFLAWSYRRVYRPLLSWKGPWENR